MIWYTTIKYPCMSCMYIVAHVIEGRYLISGASAMKSMPYCRTFCSISFFNWCRNLLSSMLVVVSSLSSYGFPMYRISNNFETFIFDMATLNTVVTLEFWVFAPLWFIMFGWMKGWTCISVDASFCFSCQTWFLSLYLIENASQWW